MHSACAVGMSKTVTGRCIPREHMRHRWAVLTAFALVIPCLAPAAHGEETGPRSFTILAAGDILIHTRQARLAAQSAGGDGWDFWPQMQHIEPWVASADLAICHLEVPLSSTNTGLSYKPAGFLVPNQLADAIGRTGWDTCSTATNHALDAGLDGVTTTLDELDARGIGHAGTARTAAERLPALHDVQGVTVAHLSFAQDFNGRRLPAGQEWAVNRIDVETILADARWARDRGADFVVLSLSWGNEFATTPSTEQQEMARTILEDGSVDLILGHHPHVSQPIGHINDRYVVYSMGNHVATMHSEWRPQEFYGTEDGLMVRVHVTEMPDGSFAAASIEVIPTWLRTSDMAVLAAQDAIARDAAPTGVLIASLDRTWSRANRFDAPGLRLAEDPFPAVTCEGRRATVVGSNGDDVLEGTDGDDVIVGRGGDDVIRSWAGDDLVCGGDGDDVIDAGFGTDRVWGGEGDDTLRGRSALDVLIGGAGFDTCATRPILVLCEAGLP